MTNKEVEEIISTFENEFVQDNGNNVEASFKDPNGDAGRAINWLRQALTTALEERDKEIGEKLSRRFGLTIGAVEMGVINKEQGFDDLLSQLQALLAKGE